MERERGGERVRKKERERDRREWVSEKERKREGERNKNGKRNNRTKALTVFVLLTFSIKLLRNPVRGHWNTLPFFSGKYFVQN